MTKKFIKVLCFSCICLLAAACGEKENVYFQSETSVAETQRSEAVPETDDTQISEENGIQTEKCFVYICGAVNTPGVYEVTQNARLYEVIEAAGGLTEDAAAELMTLSGIGQTKADSIIRYREKNGSFSSVEEIKQVEGIKEGVYNRIKDHIKVK